MLARAIARAVFNLVFGIFSTFIGFIIDLIVGTLGDVIFPGYTDYAQFIEGFWDLCFQFVGYIRSIFVIDSFTMSIIVISLTIKLTYKPTISFIKMMIHWFNNLKP